MDKYMTRHFTIEDTQMAIKHIKLCLISLAIGKIQGKPQWDITRYVLE